MVMRSPHAACCGVPLCRNATTALMTNLRAICTRKPHSVGPTFGHPFNNKAMTHLDELEGPALDLVPIKDEAHAVHYLLLVLLLAIPAQHGDRQHAVLEQVPS
eukprot:1981946-Rhodomonas_salina.1